MFSSETIYLNSYEGSVFEAMSALKKLRLELHQGILDEASYQKMSEPYLKRLTKAFEQINNRILEDQK